MQYKLGFRITKLYKCICIKDAHAVQKYLNKECTYSTSVHEIICTCSTNAQKSCPKKHQAYPPDHPRSRHTYRKHSHSTADPLGPCSRATPGAVYAARQLAGRGPVPAYGWVGSRAGFCAAGSCCSCGRRRDTRCTRTHLKKTILIITTELPQKDSKMKSPIQSYKVAGYLPYFTRLKIAY